MAKLYFRYSAMNSGKSTALIQATYNYEERGMGVVIIKPAVDTKGDNMVVSRLGAQRQVDIRLLPKLSADTALIDLMKSQSIDCVLVDEAQFLQPDQVNQLFWFAVMHDIPVMAYGLRSDFKTNGFPGSTRLLELAHELQELKTICRCGKKAVFNGRKRGQKFVSSGDQVAIDGEERVTYESLCAKCYDRFVGR